MPSKTRKQLISQNKKYSLREKCQWVYGGKRSKSNQKKTGKICHHKSVINGYFCPFHYSATKNAHKQHFKCILDAFITHPEIGIKYQEALERWNNR